MEKLVELIGLDAFDRGSSVDQTFVDHVRRDSYRRGGRALSGSRLQEIEAAAFHRELDVLHVGEMPLEPLLGRDAAPRTPREEAAHLVDAERRANSRDDVLALRVDQKLAVEFLLAGRWIAREGHAGS